MKKLISLVLACFVTLSLVGCSNNKTQDKPADKVTVKDSLEILTKVWEAYPEDNKFAAIGGDFNNMKDNEPGDLNIEDKESLKSLLIVPEDVVSSIDQASSIMHAMNANTFTCGSFHITDSKNTESFTTALKDAILTNQWMCGFPEKLVMLQLNDDYVISVFGNAEMLDAWKTTLTEQYPSAKVVVEEAF